jgi:glycosyltransferase involved in cell wall biosynthesis
MSNTNIAAILPVYNGEAYLDEALASVVAQDTDDWTLYIINDGSRDRSAEIIETWRRRYPDKIRTYANPENAGSAAAINAGLALARAHPYVLIVNADDIQAPSRFSRLLGTIRETDVDIVMHDCEVIDEAGNKTGRSKGLEPHITQRNVLAEQLRRNHFWNGLVLMKNSPDLRFDPDIKISEDYDLFLSLFYKGATFCYLDEKLLYYRVHRNNISLSYRRSEETFVQIFEKYDLHALAQKIQHAYDDPADVCISLAQVCIYRQQMQEALDYIDRGIAEGHNTPSCMATLWFMRGFILYADGEYEPSLAAFREGCRWSPQNPAFHNNIGVLSYLLHHDALEASRSIRKALELENLYSDAKHNLDAIARGSADDLRVTPRLLRSKVIRSITA